MSSHSSALLGASVLLIDDDVASAKLVHVLLRAVGCRVQVAHDASAGLLLLLAGLSVNLVLLDLQLPQMSGLELARFLRACPTTRDLRIVALSASGPEYSAAAALEAGCDAFLAKPVDTETFAQSLIPHLAPRRGS